MSETAAVLECARVAKAASREVARLSTSQKNAVLREAAAALRAHSASIIAANAKDLEENAHLSDSLKDRLALDEARVDGIASGLEQVADLPDPVGEVLEHRTMYNGIDMKKVRVPLGVMAMVYEARPNVTVDAFGLAFKTNNVALLRGSKTAWHSNQELVRILRETLETNNVTPDAVVLLPCQTHESVQDVITARGLVDVVIPRGGAGLIRAVVDNATVPTIETGAGNCHVYIHHTAPIQRAVDIVINAKTRRPSVCNAAETVLIDVSWSGVEQLLQALVDAGVTLHGDPSAFPGFAVVPATEQDWEEEYLSNDIAVKLVSGIDEALDHIARYSTGHTEAIVADDAEAEQAFALGVDSAAVMINASTAFTDGEQYGMGAEIGISTQKLHARGPMALPELTSYKWILTGEGQTRA
ncbi:MAG: glutamate-5-semialdehyde dehydrogenase [Corynebacterium sp.]|nr:glutamate-5-semialdehyde dehydrogenase [Corynebacterium sp.]